MKLKYQLPDFYQNILPQKFLNWDVQESKANCSDCSMARDKHRRQIYYAADLKCCTFHPFLPNYLVGAILSDARHAPAAEILRDKIKRREYALPIGMVAPVRYQLEFKKNRASEFGLNKDWLCPYYDRQQQNCGVWRYRGVVCTTFYCQSSFGKAGQNFWSSTSDYLSYVEMALMEEALVYLDFSPRQVNALTEYLNRDSGTASEAKSWVLPAAKFKSLWNGYTDIESFYKKSFEIVCKLDKKSFKELMGQTGEELETALYHSHARINEV